MRWRVGRIRTTAVDGFDDGKALAINNVVAPDREADVQGTQLHVFGRSGTCNNNIPKIQECLQVRILGGLASGARQADRHRELQ